MSEIDAFPENIFCNSLLLGLLFFPICYVFSEAFPYFDLTSSSHTYVRTYSYIYQTEANGFKGETKRKKKNLQQ